MTQRQIAKQYGIAQNTVSQAMKKMAIPAQKPAARQYVGVDQKICTKCQESKTLDQFSKRSRRSDGLSPWCKQCDQKHQTNYYHAEPEKHRSKSREAAQRRRNTKEGKAQLAKIAKRCWDNGRKDRDKAYKQSLKDKHFFVWRARQWSASYHVKITAQDLARLWKSQRGQCALSGRKLSRNAHLDHIIPESKGGNHTIDNLRWLDPQVNVARGNMADEEFIAMCEQICNNAEYVGRCIMAAEAERQVVA